MRRRDFITLGVAGAAGAALVGCKDILGPAEGSRLDLTLPTTPNGEPFSSGLHSLGLEMQRDGLVYIPANYNASVAAPLILMLHGAGGSANGGIQPFISLADARGAILLAPDCRDVTWDIMEGGGYSYDVAYIRKALQLIYGKHRIDSSRVFIEGFSDGASYALGLGLSNGNLFSKVVAFSPGLIPPTAKQGKPKVFDSHGTADTVLNIDATSRVIVNKLRKDGYDVEYREFNGGHQVPADIASTAMAWLFS